MRPAPWVQVSAVAEMRCGVSLIGFLQRLLRTCNRHCLPLISGTSGDIPTTEKRTEHPADQQATRSPLPAAGGPARNHSIHRSPSLSLMQPSQATALTSSRRPLNSEFASLLTNRKTTWLATVA